MIKLNTWKTVLENHIPGLETFFKKALLRNSKLELADFATATKQDIVETLEEASVIVQAREENFETALLFGFSERWVEVLSKAILDVEEAQNNEFTKDMFKEFITHLMGVITKSLGEAGIELSILAVEIIKGGQLKRSLNRETYFSALLQIEPTFEMEGDSEESPLKLAIALGEPNKEKIEKVENEFKDENPLLNNDYAKVISKNAGYVELNRVKKRPANNESAEINKNFNMEGKNVQFENFDKSSAVKNNREVRNISMLKNVQMTLSVELGRREMPLGQILELVKGSVIELEKLAGEPVEVLVNGQQIAQGNVVVIDEHFGVRISHLSATQEHLKELS